MSCITIQHDIVGGCGRTYMIWWVDWVGPVSYSSRFVCNWNRLKQIENVLAIIQINHVALANHFRFLHHIHMIALFHRRHLKRSIMHVALFCRGHLKRSVMHVALFCGKLWNGLIPAVEDVNHACHLHHGPKPEPAHKNNSLATSSPRITAEQFDLIKYAVLANTTVSRLKGSLIDHYDQPVFGTIST
jgi:hypothetical protein